MLICEQIYEEERQLRERQVEGGGKEREEVEIERIVWRIDHKNKLDIFMLERTCN